MTESTRPARGRASRVVVVGVSPTSRSVAALEWASNEARRGRMTLRAVTAWRLPRPPATLAGRPSAEVTRTMDNLQAEADELLARSVRAVVGESSQVELLAVRGTPATVLVRSAQDADLLVLGPPHPGEVFTFRPNQLALQVIFKTSCPVVVMPPEPHTAVPGARRLASRLAAAAGSAGRPGLRSPPP